MFSMNSLFEDASRSPLCYVKQWVMFYVEELCSRYLHAFLYIGFLFFCLVLSC
jgi:hypothetical protein